MHRLETLEVEKDNFLRFENVHIRVTSVLGAVFFLPSMTLIICAFFEASTFILQYTTTYFLGLTTVVILVY